MLLNILALIISDVRVPVTSSTGSSAIKSLDGWPSYLPCGTELHELQVASLLG